MTSRAGNYMAVIAVLLTPWPILDLAQEPWGAESWYSVLALCLCFLAVLLSEWDVRTGGGAM